VFKIVATYFVRADLLAQGSSKGAKERRGKGNVVIMANTSRPQGPPASFALQGKTYSLFLAVILQPVQQKQWTVCFHLHRVHNRPGNWFSKTYKQFHSTCVAQKESNATEINESLYSMQCSAQHDWCYIAAGTTTSIFK
jgi:hypothetical protein